jgi:hypothetical protein
LLQANSTTIPKLIDISSNESDSAIAAKITELFSSDKLEHRRVLKATDNIILKTPWDSSPASQILLKPGDNLFWLCKIPTGELKIGDTVVNVVTQLLTDDIQFKAQKKIQAKKFKRLSSRYIEVEAKNDSEWIEMKQISEPHSKSRLSMIKKPKHQSKSVNRKMIRDIKRRLSFLSKENRLWTEIGEEACEDSNKPLKRKKKGNQKKSCDDFKTVEEFVKRNYLWMIAAPVVALAACKLLSH